MCTVYFEAIFLSFSISYASFRICCSNSRRTVDTVLLLVGFLKTKSIIVLGLLHQGANNPNAIRSDSLVTCCAVRFFFCDDDDDDDKRGGSFLIVEGNGMYFWIFLGFNNSGKQQLSGVILLLGCFGGEDNEVCAKVDAD